jgi:hypothetical protein
MLRPEVFLFIATSSAEWNKVINLIFGPIFGIQTVSTVPVLAEYVIFEVWVNVAVTVGNLLRITAGVWAIT